ncbi:MAG: hypothetical protein WBA12_15135 [Catalinimonas sp.]
MLLDRLREVDDPLLWRQVRRLLDTHTRLRHLPDAWRTLQDAPRPPLRRHLPAPALDTRLGRYESRVAPWVFGVALLMLVVFGTLLMTVTGDNSFGYFGTYVGVLSGIGAAGWLLFVGDLAWTLWLVRCERHTLPLRTWRRRVGMLLFPPLRLGGRHLLDRDRTWLPRWGWSQVNESLYEELRRSFSVPLLVIALLIVPALVIELKFLDQAEARFPGVDWSFWLELVQALIWIAFTFEFLLLFAYTDDRTSYLKKNWIDVLIILLPLVSFLRTFRLAQVMRFKYLARTWKLRGVVTKARQGLILAEVLQRLFAPNPQRRLRALQKKLRDNRRERAELESALLKLAEDEALQP